MKVGRLEVVLEDGLGSVLGCLGLGAIRAEKALRLSGLVVVESDLGAAAAMSLMGDGDFSSSLPLVVNMSWCFAPFVLSFPCD